MSETNLEKLVEKLTNFQSGNTDQDDYDKFRISSLDKTSSKLVFHLDLMFNALTTQESRRRKIVLLPRNYKGKPSG